MSDLAEARGRCLCGATGITAKKLSRDVGACHCGMCRKWAGGPLLAVDAGSDVSLEGEDNITVFDSSDWAERGFCRRCGSHLFYRIKANNQYIVPVGLFEDDQRFVLEHQIFIDEKPGFYDFANQTRNMTGAEVFAQYAPKSE